jgi:4-amino-4-deoxy-L-arabinose transferase-like glycosyltransferase
VSAEPVINAAETSSWQRFTLVCLGFIALIFAAIAPTLRMLEFSNGAEALNVTTAMEMRRGGEWVVPTLQGEARVRKPPLPAWVTAFAIAPRTMALIDSIDLPARDAGFVRLAWETRWPALLAGCVMLLATACMARMLYGDRCGILALLVAGTSLLFLRFTRYSTTDIQLAMWVSVANAFLLAAVLKQRWWLGCIAGGAALGLGIMCKGPVALVQSVLPIALFAAFAVRGAPLRRWLPATLGGVAAMLAVALPWVIVVILREPDAWRIWFSEVTRVGARQDATGKWYAYGALLPYMAPWIVFYLGAWVIAIVRRSRADVLAMLMVAAPLVVMSIAKDRSERYMLPLLPAAATLAAMGIMELVRRTPIVLAHAIVVLGIACFPLAGLLLHPPWYPLGFAVAVSCVGAAMAVAATLLQLRGRNWLVCCTVAVMLLMQAVFMTGYRHTREGSAELRPLADAILQKYPTAEVFNAHPRGKRPPTELGVYLNRVLQLTDDPAAIPQSQRPQVVLMIQGQNDPDPAPGGGWTVIDKRKRDKDWWWAFGRDGE